VQIAEKQLLRVVLSYVVHCCAIKKNVIDASQLYDVAMYTGHSRLSTQP